MIKEVGIRGIRSVADVTLQLGGLTVLIGENGSGKSTILEALELLRRATYPAFLQDLNVIHGGLFGLGAPNGFQLSIVFEEGGQSWKYELSVGAQGPHAAIGHETFAMAHQPSVKLMYRRGQKSTLIEPGGNEVPINVPDDQPALAVVGSANPKSGLGRLYRLLQGIAVHVPFEVTPRWVGQAHNRPYDLRRSVTFMPAKSLDRLGTNLANVFAALRNQDNWSETMDLVRMGLGLDVDNVAVEADPGGGAAALSLKLKSLDKPIPAQGLSEGMLAFLCFVGLRQLETPNRSLLAFDEPDLHLHPALLARVVGFFEAIGAEHPVIVATHSDTLLDCLHEPSREVVVCELDAERHTRLRSLDATALDKWLADFRGVGALRGEGYLDSVVERPDSSATGE